jgi:protoporphyrinogen IX oxidase
MLLWLKAFHIIFIITWFAGLFYLPRLFVYHCTVTDELSNERFKLMEHKLYFYITTPSAILTLILGFALISAYGHQVLLEWHWLQVKLAMVALLLGFHWYCGQILKAFKSNNNQHSERFYRLFNEIPVVPLIVIVIMAVVRPF